MRDNDLWAIDHNLRSSVLCPTFGNNMSMSIKTSPYMGSLLCQVKIQIGRIVLVLFFVNSGFIAHKQC